MKTLPSERSKSHYAIRVEAILAHGDIGYKFCWLLLSEDQTQGTPIRNESNGAVTKDHWEDNNQLVHQLGTSQMA